MSKPLTIATWNVNSLRVRLPHLEQWIAGGGAGVDVFGLQETKLTDAEFPAADLEKLGLRGAWHGQKTYNGVALLGREPPTDVQTGIPGYADTQSRVISGTVVRPGGSVRVIDIYVPNGSEVGSEKYAYKLEWLSHLKTWLTGELVRHEHVVVVGDYNIAPEDRDVHDPAKWQGQVLVSDAERAALRGLLDLGFVDVFRRFEQPEKSFSWWDYRMMAFRRNAGLRIDLVLASPALAARCTACTIDREPRKWERPSDHTPVLATFDV
jgi:exodeoxyribonuclease-3